MPSVFPRLVVNILHPPRLNSLIRLPQPQRHATYLSSSPAAAIPLPRNIGRENWRRLALNLRESPHYDLLPGEDAP